MFALLKGIKDCYCRMPYRIAVKDKAASLPKKKYATTISYPNFIAKCSIMIVS
jgi:hypothetical protein